MPVLHPGQSCFCNYLTEDQCGNGPEARWVWSVDRQGTQLALNVGSEPCAWSWSAEQWEGLSEYTTNRKGVDWSVKLKIIKEN